MFAERFDIKRDATAIRTMDFLFFKINGDGGVFAAFGIIHQLVDIFLRQTDRQNAVLEAVVIENVGKAWRDDAANAEIKQRPRRMFTR